MKKHLFTLLCVLLLLLLTTGCGPGSSVDVTTPETTVTLTTPGVNPLVNEPGTNGVAGVVQGLWHGIIAPVTLLLSFFNESIQMYEVHNNGSEYNLGYLLGVAIVFLLLGITSRR